MYARINKGEKAIRRTAFSRFLGLHASVARRDADAGKRISAWHQKQVVTDVRHDDLKPALIRGDEPHGGTELATRPEVCVDARVEGQPAVPRHHHRKPQPLTLVHGQRDALGGLFCQPRPQLLL